MGLYGVLLKDLALATGKRVKAVSTDGGELVITFDDGTYLRFVVEIDDDDEMIIAQVIG